MSRPIKYRAWDNVKNKMYYVGEEDNISFTFDSNGIVAVDLSETEQEFKYLHHLKYMQYIGLNDRDGNEIFAGDVIRFPDSYMRCGSGEWEEIESAGVIKWDDEHAQYYVTNRESIDMDTLWEFIDDIEVLGNIYTHPHLMEVSNG